MKCNMKSNLHEKMFEEQKPIRKKKSLVSGCPTDPYILGSTECFFKPIVILKSIIRFFKGFDTFSTQKCFL